MAPFRRNRSALLLALISAAFAGQALATAARVDFVSGAVTVSNSDGRERPLVRGTEIDNGDTVRTAEGGRAQLRFSDGAYVSLQPNSEFSIKEYRFDGKADGNERGFFALAKGAMRTVTGLVGRTNRDRYRITTPTATVGIRGTGGVIQILNDGATLVVGTSGIWSLTNPVGSLDIPAGVSGLAPSKPDQPPQQTTQVPQSGPAPVETQQVVVSQGEQRTDTGAPAILPKVVLVTGDGYSYTALQDQFGPAFVDGDGVFVEFNAAGQMVAADNGRVKLGPGGAHTDSGTDGILAWGRWIGEVALSSDGTTIKNYSANQGLHYVVGMPTPVLPTSGGGSYTLAGATRPTYVSGGTGPGSFSGTIDVTFGGAGSINGNFAVSMPDASYTWTWSTSPSVRFTAGASSISGCFSGCSASVNGFFSGANAERIGVGYHVQDLGKDIFGAAAFKKN